MNRKLDIGGGIAKAYLALVLLFLYVPILVMALLAFNRSPLYQMPFEFDLAFPVMHAYGDKMQWFNFTVSGFY